MQINRSFNLETGRAGSHNQTKCELMAQDTHPKLQARSLHSTEWANKNILPAINYI